MRRNSIITLAIALFVLLSLAACHQEHGVPTDFTAGTEQTPASSDLPGPSVQTTDASVGDPVPTLAEHQKVYDFFQYGGKKTSQVIYDRYDLSNCIEGCYYSADKETGDIRLLYDDQIRLFDTSGWYTDAGIDKNGEKIRLYACYSKIAYTRNTDPDKLYYMDWRGTFRDVLVFDGRGKEIVDIEIMANTFEMEQAAVLTEDGTVFIVNIKDGSATAILTGIEVSKLIGFGYNDDRLVRQIAYKDAEEYEWVLDLETGKHFRIE